VALYADPGREGVGEFFRRVAAGGFNVRVRRTQVHWLSSRPEVWIYQVTRTQAQSRYS
jgi:hypothetical protein